jgi:STAS domain-containing protein
MEHSEAPVKVVRTGDATWLMALQGEHDLATSNAIAQALQAVPRVATVVVDLSAVSFVDPSFLRALSTYRGYPEHIVLVAPNGGPSRRLLGLMGAGRELRIVASRREALALARRRDHWSAPVRWDVGMTRPAVEAHTASTQQRQAGAWVMNAGKPVRPDAR